MFKNKNNSRTANKNIQFPIVLELFHIESNMIDMWVNEPNIVQDSHTFLRITPDKIHRKSSNVLGNFAFPLLLSFAFFLQKP